MPVCSYKKRKNRKICIGDLDTEITIDSRDITPPSGYSVDFVETFTGTVVAWALIETVSGKSIFDSTNIERTLTHNIYIRFITGLTAENWIVLKGQRVDIIEVEDYENRSEFMVLKCNDRGDISNPANEI